MPTQLCYRKSVQFKTSPATLDEKQRSVEVVGATEQAVEVFDPERWAVVREVLLMSGCEMPATRQVPLIDSHQRDRGAASVLGSYRDMVVDGDQLLGRVHFSKAAEAESPWMKVREGHLTDFSVGYKPIESAWIPEGESKAIKGRTFQGPVKITSRWRVKELSVVPIGADELAKARSGDAPQPTTQHANERISVMPENASTTTHTTEDQVAAAVRIERERVAEIEAMGRTFSIIRSEIDPLVNSGASLDEARKSIMGIVARRQVATPPAIQFAVDETEKRAEAIIDGLCLRAGVSLDKPAPGANEYRATPLYQIAKECLLAAGHRKVSGMSRLEIVTEAMSQRAHVTGDFPYLLANALGKTLRTAYELAPGTYERWVKITDGVDFKEMSRTQLSEAPDLDVVPEHGEYKYGGFGDSAEVFRIQKYGKLFAITREAIVNDDLSAFVRVPLAFAMSAKRKVNAAVYGILTGNPLMGDGIALFDASTHKNFTSTGGAPSINTLSAGRLAMRLQTGLNGAVLNIAPRFLIVPAALETVADQLLNSIADLADNKSAGVTNPFHKKLEPVVESLLDASDNNAWYLAADPSAIDTVELCFLGGNRVPYLETRDGWQVDGVEYKVRIEFGVKALDWRGLYMNDGE
jgi:hypothetical protein